MTAFVFRKIIVCYGLDRIQDEIHFVICFVIDCYAFQKQITYCSTITVTFTFQFKMKRSAAPSATNNGAASKKMRPTKNEECESNRKPPSASQLVPRVPKTIPATPLNARQQKAFHYLLSGASYVSVIEGNADNIPKLREKCAINFHGYDDDHIGVVRDFLEGNGRFDLLWTDGRISGGLGNLSGLMEV